MVNRGSLKILNSIQILFIAENPSDLLLRFQQGEYHFYKLDENLWDSKVIKIFSALPNLLQVCLLGHNHLTCPFLTDISASLAFSGI